MKRSLLKQYICIVAFLLLVIQGCNFPGMAGESLSSDEIVQTSVALTLAAGQENGGNGEEPEDEEVAPVPTNTDALFPTITLTPTLTLSPTITLTPTLEVAMVSVSVDTNCRTGPGKIYDYIGALLVGESAEVVGQSMDGLYWIIENPDLSGECWLWGEYATVVGPTDELARYTPPPSPTPFFIWDGDWSTYNGPAGGVLVTLNMTVTVDGMTFTAVQDIGGGETVNFTGTISDDYLTVSGTWVGAGGTGTFALFALGENQFQGNLSDGADVFAMCGSRGGAGQPVPCILP